MIFGPKKPKVARSPAWPKTRKLWLKAHSICAACGETKKLEVHHKIPVSWDDALELDLSNFITLCEQKHNCHFIFGHLLDWHSRNPNVETDTAKYLYEKMNRPYPK